MLGLGTPKLGACIPLTLEAQDLNTGGLCPPNTEAWDPKTRAHIVLMPGLMTPKPGLHIPPDTGAQDPNSGDLHPPNAGAWDPSTGASHPPSAAQQVLPLSGSLPCCGV